MPTQIKPRDYQGEAIAALEAGREAGARRQLVALPTGSGKTIVAAMDIKEVLETELGGALFVAHRDELISQAADKISRVWPEVTVGRVKASDNELGREVTVASVQTIYRDDRLQDVVRHPYSILYIDEAHHAAAPTYRKVIDAVTAANPDIIVVGLTATPVRADATKLGDVFDSVTYHKSMIDLIEAGYLSDIALKRVELKVDLDKVRRMHGELKSSDLRKILVQQSVMDVMVEAWKDYAKPRRTLVFCVDVEHARQMRNAFHNAGVSSEYVYGDTPQDERRDILKRFQHGKFRVLCNCQVLTEGFDDEAVQVFDGAWADPLECIMLARPTLSQSLFIQMVGRGVRPGPGKENCLVLDFGYNTKRHHLVQLPHLFGFAPLPLPSKRKLKEDEEEKVPDEFPSVLAIVRAAKDVDAKAPPPRAGFRWASSEVGFCLSIGSTHGYLVIRQASEVSDGNYHVYHYAEPDGGHDEEERVRPKPDQYIEHQLTSTPMPFEWAFGLAEDSVRELLSARDKGSKSMSRATRVIDREAEWHKQPPSPKQLAVLSKAKRVPRTKGEAGEMITAMIVERIVRAQAKATRPQLRYLRAKHISHHPDHLTKAGASRLIGEYKNCNEQDPDPIQVEDGDELFATDWWCDHCQRKLYFISERRSQRCLACGHRGVGMVNNEAVSG
jgi:superfamily II DNA or RNA helicase